MKRLLLALAVVLMLPALAVPVAAGEYDATLVHCRGADLDRAGMIRVTCPLELGPGQVVTIYVWFAPWALEPGGLTPAWQVQGASYPLIVNPIREEGVQDPLEYSNGLTRNNNAKFRVWNYATVAQDVTLIWLLRP